MSVSVTRLRSFLVLAETKSFIETAKIVGRSQPAVTTQIRTLEQVLGAALFHRETRAIRLTPEGELLFRRVKPLLDDLDSLVHDFSRMASLASGEVRFGASPTLACYILPEVIRTFRARHPGIRTLFSDEPAKRLETMVVADELDFYFGPRPSEKSGLQFKSIGTDKYVIVAPKNHSLARKPSIDVRDTVAYPILLLSVGTSVRDDIDNFFGKLGLALHPVEEVSNHYTLGGLVEAGCGITFLPRSAYPVIAHPGTVVVDIVNAGFVRTLGVATRRNYSPSPAAKAFIATMVPLVRTMLSGRRLAKTTA